METSFAYGLAELGEDDFLAMLNLVEQLARFVLRLDVQVTSTEFQQNVGRYQYAALQGPVVITKKGRPHTVLISAAPFEIVTKGRIARPVEELDDDTLRGNCRQLGGQHACRIG